MTKEIFLPKGFVALVSDVDYEDLKQFTWWINAAGRDDTGYAYTQHKCEETGKRKTEYMHRRITKCPAHLVVDHKNRDRLHNTRSNLRITTFSYNNANRRVWGGNNFRGVSRNGFRFRSRITLNEKTLDLGSFATAEEAASAYDEAAFETFGEFAWLNFPDEYPSTPDSTDKIFEDVPF